MLNDNNIKGKRGKVPANTLVRLLLQLMKATVLAESCCYFFNFHRTLSIPAMSTDARHVQHKQPKVNDWIFYSTNMLLHPPTNQNRFFRNTMLQQF